MDSYRYREWMGGMTDKPTTSLLDEIEKIRESVPDDAWDALDKEMNSMTEIELRRIDLIEAIDNYIKVRVKESLVEIAVEQQKEKTAALKKYVE